MWFASILLRISGFGGLQTRLSRTRKWNQLGSPSSTGPCLGGWELGKYVCLCGVCVCVRVCVCVCMCARAMRGALNLKIWYLSKMIWLFPESWWGPSWGWSSQGPSLEEGIPFPKYQVMPKSKKQKEQKLYKKKCAQKPGRSPETQEPQELTGAGSWSGLGVRDRTST